MHDDNYSIEWQKTGTNEWRDMFPGELWTEAEAIELLEMFRTGLSTSKQGKYRAIIISEL